MHDERYDDTYLPFIREDDDDAWDDRLPCENPGCTDPMCPTKMNRDAMRIALGSMVEGMELLATVQALSQDYWGGCADRDCTFEAQMQEHFGLAGKSLSIAFLHLLDGVKMWRSLPTDWSKREEEAALQALRFLRRLNAEALAQAERRRAGSPDPRLPDQPAARTN
jgi:hypothetical protein